MQRRIAIAVTLAFTMATGVLAWVSQRGATAPPPSSALRGPDVDVFAAAVEVVLPGLENDVVAAADLTNPLDGTCLAESKRRIAGIDAVERDVLRGQAWLRWADADARAIAEPLADALAPLRACVTCGTPKPACADAARALVRVENRLEPRRVHALEPGGI